MRVGCPPVRIRGGAAKSGCGPTLALRPGTMHRKLLIRRVVVVNCQANLFEIVAATHPSCSLTSRLDSWQEKAHQYANDRDHDQQLDEGESPATILSLHHKAF